MSSWANGLGPALDEGFIGVFNVGTELPGDGTGPKKFNIKYKFLFRNFWTKQNF